MSQLDDDLDERDMFLDVESDILKYVSCAPPIIKEIKDEEDPFKYNFS
jgi:hypothetical protein